MSVISRVTAPVGNPLDQLTAPFSSWKVGFDRARLRSFMHRSSMTRPAGTSATCRIRRSGTPSVCQTLIGLQPSECDRGTWALTTPRIVHCRTSPERPRRPGSAPVVRIRYRRDTGTVPAGPMLRVMRQDTRATHIPVLRGLATVMLVGVALFPPGGPAGAAGAADQASRKLEAGYEQQPASVGTPICSSATACVVPFSLLGVSTGDVAGMFVQSGAGSRMANGSLYAN